jgi:FAD/FMN-containing dehydrogenase
MMARDYASFGRIVPAQRPAIGCNEAAMRLKSGEAEGQSLLAVGNTRSYGDSCHNDAGLLVDMRGANRILSFDPETGVLEAETGVQLADIIAFAAPHGFFPAVVPGTQFITLGGAIANDVHGKNHHRRGSFGCHVLSLQVLRSDGEVHRCTAKQNRALFAATIGGLGLTGLILSASIRLMRVACLDVIQTVTPFSCLEEFSTFRGGRTNATNTQSRG